MSIVSAAAESSRKHQIAYLVLRASTTALGIAWGFLFTAILVRVLGSHEFAFFALANGIAISLSMADLGIAKVALLALAYRGTSRDNPTGLKTALVSYYILAALLAAAVTAIGFGIFASSTKPLLVILFIPGVVAGLPWLMLQQFAMAEGRYLAIEAIDFCRRAIQILALVCVPFGLSPLAAMSVYLASWAAALVGACAVSGVSAKGLISVRTNAEVVSRFAKDNRRRLIDSIAFHGSELIVYQFPLLMVPIAFGVGWPVLAVDLFYKFHRTATAGYRIGTESQVPLVLDAQRNGDARLMRRALVRAAYISTFVLIVLTVLLGPLGDRIILALLGSNSGVPTSVASLALLFCIINAVQNICGSYLLHTGRLGKLRRANTIVVLLLAALGVVMALSWLNFVQAMVVYCAIYAVGAVVLYVDMTSCLIEARGPGRL